MVGFTREKAMAPHSSILLLGKSHGWRSLEGCSPWGHWGLDTTEWLHFHFSLSCIGEGNGNPLQCSCLENLRDGEPGGLPSMGSHSVGHNWSNIAAAAAAAGLYSLNPSGNTHIFWFYSNHHLGPFYSISLAISCIDYSDTCHGPKWAHESS